VEEEFSLMSFNVWFSPHRQLSRCLALIDEIEKEDPSCICLQEATVKFLKIFLNDKRIQTKYCISTSVEEFAALTVNFGYDAFMLVKRPYVGDLYRFQLTSVYGRSLILNVQKKSFAISTIHLESTKNGAANRRQQMAEIYGLWETYDCDKNGFFCGDLNHCEKLNGENHLQPGKAEE
jgi:hypothetical protein